MGGKGAMELQITYLCPKNKSGTNHWAFFEGS